MDSVDAALENPLAAYPLDPARAWRPEWDPEDVADLSEGSLLTLIFGLMAAEMRIWMPGVELVVLALMFSLSHESVGPCPGSRFEDAWRIFSMVCLQTVQRA